MKKVLSFLLIILSFAGCKDSLKVKTAPGYPRWITDNTIHSDQTSGISFIKASEGTRLFLIADDIGKIYHLSITNDTLFKLNEVYLSSAVNDYLKDFPKKDFEEIFFDKYTGNVFLSIEGNGPDFIKYAGIYKITFSHGVESDSVTAIEKLNIQPAGKIMQYVAGNIGFEGFTADENYFYAGLEGFEKDNVFADSTIIYVINKKTLQVENSISTKNYGIHTICGLYSDKNKSLYGIDRNNKKIFHITFDGSLNIKESAVADFKTSIPKFPGFDYVAALESITIDEEGSLYLTDDPWKKFYIPPADVMTKLDLTTQDNFKNYIPVIYKFNIDK